MPDSLIDNIDSLITAHQDGYSLAQRFYCDDAVFTRDVDAVLGNGWLLVDHVSRIPKKGDYFLFEIANEQIIIVRESDETINAFFNVCRHRGSRVCLEHEGNRKLFTCPYHAWTYQLDGALRGARELPENFDTAGFGLNRCYIRVFHGLIFISLQKGGPPDFDTEYAGFSRVLEFQGIEGTRIAAKRDYPTDANWKLVVENFLECYHCAPAHPEYCSIHPAQQLAAIGAGPGSGSPAELEKYQGALDDWRAQTAALGHPIDEIDLDESTQSMGQVMRFPINDRGFESETRDGRPACKKLLGEIRQTDYGETAVSFGPLAYLLASNDYAVIVRFTPQAAMQTNVQMTWLVHEEAQEGRDYDPDNLVWLWDVTLRQDKEITENNQSGIRSSRYQPGPYVDSELRVVTFTRWYFNQLAATRSDAGDV